jgi:hypothetical protein
LKVGGIFEINTPLAPPWGRSLFWKCPHFSSINVHFTTT